MEILNYIALYNFDRFLHYFEGIHLDIPKETVNALAADFP
jgi:hypothetical protein